MVGWLPCGDLRGPCGKRVIFIVFAGYALTKSIHSSHRANNRRTHFPRAAQGRPEGGPRAAQGRPKGDERATKGRRRNTLSPTKVLTLAHTRPDVKKLGRRRYAFPYLQVCSVKGRPKGGPRAAQGRPKGDERATKGRRTENFIPVNSSHPCPYPAGTRAADGRPTGGRRAADGRPWVGKLQTVSGCLHFLGTPLPKTAGRLRLFACP